ncbi:MAG TPA: flagellar basal body-associated FliL family protein [Gemmatimonadaceae bacterium]|nr:flagellar basal body-associated FliL family protein [Gemmatimonadaceae bacterium]
MADADAAATPDTPPKAGGLKAKLPLILGIILGLGVGAGTGAMVVGPATARTMGYTLPDSVVAALNAVAAAKAGDHGEEGGDHGEEGGDHAAEGEGGEGAAAPAVLTLDNLVLNPAGSGGARFLLLTVAIECKDAASVTTMQARDAELRDVVLTTLGLKTVEQLAEIGARDQIKTDLVGALNERFGKKTVVRVYFPQFVVQ